MKRIITASLLMHCCVLAIAQSFNLRCDPFAQWAGETAWGIEVSDSGQYVVIVSAPFYDSLFYSSVVTSLLVDQQGEVLQVDRVIDPLHATYPGWCNSVGMRADGGFVVGGNTFRTDSMDNWISRAALFMISSDGGFETPYVVGPDNQSWIGRQAKQTPDGGYVICGETSAVGNGDAFVIRTDAQGNEEWLRTYGGNWADYIVSVDNSIGAGYFTGGQLRISSGNQQFWVQCLNDTGAVVWSKEWGGGFKETNAHITMAQNGDVLVAGGWAYGNNALFKRYLARLDPTDGAIVWEKEYAGMEIDAVLYVAQEIEPGADLISAGSGTEVADVFGVLIRTTSEGDSLWMRRYHYSDSLVTNARGFFRDVVPTPDGGFIACGSAFSVMAADTMLYSQDVWVVKVDSMGCIEPGCQLIQGMATQITNLRGALTVAPNPVAGGGNVQVSIALPENFVPQGGLRLTVVSSDGRVVQEETVANGNGPFTLSPSHSHTLSLSHLSSGLYHLHLSDATRWISGAKLIIE